MIPYILSLHQNLTPSLLILFFVAALVLGMSKAGISGLSIATIPVMALIFGAK